MRDKAIADMFTALLPHVSRLVVTRASNARSADPEMLADIARATAPGLPIAIEPRVEDALASAWRESSRIVVAGSIFLLGDVLKSIGGS
jgi:folylpolyglutamate synthase/dihydropteroate synthase